jgi:hypothetical protein
MYRHDDLLLKIVVLVRLEDSRPLYVSWWKKKQAYLLGADENGNFLLHYCDGSIRYWNHQTQSELKIAASIREFLKGLKAE